MSNQMFNSTITTRDIKNVLDFGRRNKVSVMLWGPPGCGKSDIMRQYAEEYSGKSADESYIDIRLAMEVPENLRGIAIPTTLEDGSVETVYAVPSYWPTDPNWEGVIGFDEITSAPPSMQVVAYQALLDRRIGDIKFPEGAVVCGAGNREGEGLVYRLLPAISNRLVQVEVRPDFEVWAEDFAYDHGVHGAIMSFLQQQPTSFHTGDKVDESDCPAFASGRSWVNGVNNILKDMENGLLSKTLAFTLIEGSVGTGVTASFRSHYNYGHKLPNPKDVLEGKNPQFDVDNPSASYTLAYNCFGMWVQNFKNPEFSDDALVEQVNNFFMYLRDNTQTQDETELHIAFVKKVTNYIKANKKQERSVGSKLLRGSNAISNVLRDYREIRDSIAEQENAA